MSRKGIGALIGLRVTTGFYGILLVAGVLLVFMVLFSFRAKEYQQKLTADAVDISTNTSILAYLRAPITVHGETMPVAEALARAAATGDFTPLHGDIRQFLGQLPQPHPSSGWRYRLERLPEGEELDAVVPFDIIGWYEVKRVRYTIPSYDPHHDLLVTFALECGDARCA